MAVEVMSKVWKLDLPQNKKLVLLAIADHANDEGIAWPSQGRIAWKTGYKRRNIKRILDELIEDGLLRIMRAGRGRGNSTVHKLTLENAKQLPEYNADDYYTPFKEKVTPLTPNNTKGAFPDEKVHSEVIKGVTANAPEPSLEPSLEPSFSASKSDAVPGAIPTDEVIDPPLKIFRTTSSTGEKPPARKPTKKKEITKNNGKTDPRTKPLLKEFEKLLGYPLPNYGQEGTAAKKMLKDGYTPSDILACWKDMQQNEFWEKTHCGLASVNKQIGKWKQSHSPNGKKVINV